MIDLSTVPPEESLAGFRSTPSVVYDLNIDGKAGSTFMLPGVNRYTTQVIFNGLEGLNYDTSNGLNSSFLEFDISKLEEGNYNTVFTLTDRYGTTVDKEILIRITNTTSK